jgi:hypothetical protein
MAMFDEIKRALDRVGSPLASAPPMSPDRKAFDKRAAEIGKARRPRDNLKKSRKNQRQSLIGQALAAELGAKEGPKAKRRIGSSPIGPLGGLSKLGV